MRHEYLSRLRAGAALIIGATCAVGGTATAATAQEPTATPTVQTSASAEGRDAELQTTEQPEQTASGAYIEDIVIEARKTAENLQDTPLAVTVATGEDLEERSIFQLIDLQQQTPSLRITQAALSTSSAFISMRGQVMTNFRLTTDTAVGIYIDGVYYPHGFGTAASDFWDIGRVEVLKGPQGTLYGRSTTGGAISIYTNEPSNEWEGRVRFRLAEHGEWAAAGMFNAPLSDTLSLRVAAEHHERDGYGVNLFNGRDLGDTFATSVRGALRWEASDSITATLRADYADINDVAQAFKGLTMFAPGAPVELGGTAAATGVIEVARELGLIGPVFTPDELAAAIPTALAAANGFSGGDPDDGTLDTHPFDNSRIYGGSLTVDADLTDWISLRSITALRYFDRHGALDLDGTPFLLLAYPEMRTNYEQFSQETQLSGDALQDRLRYIVGVFYSRETGNDLYVQRAAQVLSGFTTNIQEGDITNTSVGLFGQLQFEIIDGLTATVGGRYSWDKRELISFNRNAVSCLATGTPLATTPVCRSDHEVNFGEPSYNISLDYQATPDILLYARHARGYRTGGIELASGSAASPEAAALAFTPFRPEILQDYEIGVKSDWFGNRLRVNAALYHSDYSDIQVSISVPNPNGPGVIGVIQNGPSATIDGVELELQAVPIEGLELNGTLAYTDSEYRNYVSGVQDFSGTPLLLTPEWAYTLSAAYTFDTGIGDLRSQVDWIHEDETRASIPNGVRDAFDIVNVRMTLNIDSQDMSVSIFAKNLFDERYFPFRLDARTGLGFIYNGPYNPPRTIGIEVSKSF